ncbi:MAG: hypothetical protein LBI13_10230 [Streptococcaceae bacterium]|jgi:succinate dehydrogenase hydrophobic anchor subunit|nr:hypothetical protein [Streptococcaceae bacterium]
MDMVLSLWLFRVPIIWIFFQLIFLLPTLRKSKLNKWILLDLSAIIVGFLIILALSLSGMSGGDIREGWGGFVASIIFIFWLIYSAVAALVHWLIVVAVRKYKKGAV